MEKRIKRNNFSISNIERSSSTKEESDKKSLDLSLKGMENVAKNLKDESRGKDKK